MVKPRLRIRPHYIVVWDGDNQEWAAWVIGAGSWEHNRATVQGRSKKSPVKALRLLRKEIKRHGV